MESEFVKYIAQDLAVPVPDGISHGFHTFGAHRGALSTLYELYQQECWADLRETEAIIQLTEKFLGHYDREVTNISACNSLFLNAAPPNLQWGGEMSNEFENALWARHALRGKLGVLRAFQRVEVMQNKYNRQTFDRLSRVESVHLLSKCKFSKELWTYIEQTSC